MFEHIYYVFYPNSEPLLTKVITDKTWEEYEKFCVNKLEYVKTERIK